MSIRFTKLPKTSFSGLEYQNIIEDIIALVRENPDYNEQYDDFLSSNAGRMLIELFAYVTDQLATRIDWSVNEGFLSTATQKNSVINILKLIGYNFSLPQAAQVEVRVIPSVYYSSFYLSKGYTQEDGLDIFSLTAEDRNGAKKSFEALRIEDGIIDYKNPPEIIFGTPVTFFEGKSYIDNADITTDNNEVITLSKQPVIKDTIQVFLNGTENRLVSVDSFLDPRTHKEEDEQGNPIPLTYRINVEDNDVVTIEFPPSSIVTNESRRPSQGDTITVFYRVGGGEAGNIVSRAISFSRKIVIYDEFGNALGNHLVEFENRTSAFGGTNSETKEQAIERAPTMIQTAQKTVTENDYDAILNAYDDMIKAKAFGNSNENLPPEDVYNLFGEYIHPLHTWIFALLKKAGWEDISPSEYNDFLWCSKRLENRFNEIHSFRKGENNYEITKKQSSINSNEDFKNFVTLTTPEPFKEDDAFFEDDFRAKLTHIPVDTNYFADIEHENEFDMGLTTNEGMFDKDHLTLTEYIQPELISQRSLHNQVNTTEYYNLRISLDNHSSVDVTIPGGINTIETIVEEINSDFKTLYNNGEDVEKGYQEITIPSALSFAGLSLNTNYSFFVNGREYSFTTPDNTINFGNLAELIQNSMFFPITGDTEKDSSVIANIPNYMHRLHEGMMIMVEGNLAEIERVHRLENYIVLNTTVSYTGNITVWACGYDVSVNEDNDAIRITNMYDLPKYTVRIERGITHNDLIQEIYNLGELINVPYPNIPVEEESNRSGRHILIGVEDPDVESNTECSFKINGYTFTITIEPGHTINNVADSINQVINFGPGNTNRNYTVVLDEIEFEEEMQDVLIIRNRTSASVYFEDINLLEEIGVEESINEAGGDYGQVAEVLEKGEEKFIHLYSPGIGPAANITFHVPSNHDATSRIFGFNGEKHIYGTKTATINDDGDIVFENGSFQFLNRIKTFYLHYVTEEVEDNKIILGTYFSDTYDVDNPRYRDPIDRIYNTAYNMKEKTIDYYNSNFFVKFTKNRTNNPSIYTIENDWDLQQNTIPSIRTVEDPDELNFTNAYRMRIKIDDNDFVSIDVTGDNGSKGDGYTIEEINDAINRNIKQALQIDKNFTFIDDINNTIVIHSRTNFSTSCIEIEDDESFSCVSNLFSGVPVTSYPEGDYYIYINESDEIELHKLTENIPDYNFYTHVVSDKRYVEGVYDGKEGRAGYPIGSLDEDGLDAYMSNHKIVGIENIYKQPNFKTFDIKGTIFYDPLYSQEEIRNKIKSILQKEFSLERARFGKRVYKSKILSLLHDIKGIESINIDFFGTNDGNTFTHYENYIPANFNEIVVLCEDIVEQGNQIHGIMFSYRRSE